MSDRLVKLANALDNSCERAPQHGWEPQGFAVDLTKLDERLRELYAAEQSEAIRLAEIRGFARKLEGRYNFPGTLAGMGDHILAIEAENAALKAELAAAQALNRMREAADAPRGIELTDLSREELIDNLRSHYRPAAQPADRPDDAEG